jgi:hypothetical protein
MFECETLGAGAAERAMPYVLLAPVSPIAIPHH